MYTVFKAGDKVRFKKPFWCSHKNINKAARDGTVFTVLSTSTFGHFVELDSRSIKGIGSSNYSKNTMIISTDHLELVLVEALNLIF